MMRSAPRALAVSLSLLVVSLMGCGGKSGDGFTGERGKVSGTVTVGDKPVLKGCQVIFMAEKGGYTGAGIVDEAGKYVLVYGGGDGLPVGLYQIQFTAPFTPDSAAPVDPREMASKTKLTRKTASQGSESAGPFPMKYTSTTSSELTYEVKAGDNTADFKLDAE